MSLWTGAFQTFGMGVRITRSQSGKEKKCEDEIVHSINREEGQKSGVTTALEFSKSPG